MRRHLLHIVISVLDRVERFEYPLLGHVHEAHRMLAANLARDVLLKVTLQLAQPDLVLDHLPVHVVHDVAEYFVLVLPVVDLRDAVVQQIVPELAVVVVEQLLVERFQAGQVRDLRKLVKTGRGIYVNIKCDLCSICLF